MTNCFRPADYWEEACVFAKTGLTGHKSLSSMELVTYSVLVMSAVAITLGLLYVRFWFSETDRWDFLFFALSCFAVGCYSWFEIAIMRTDSIETMSRYLWWAQFPAGLTIISVAVFLHLYLNGRRKLLFWSIIGLRSLGLILNVFMDPSLQFSKIISIDRVNFFGETVSAPIGVGRPLGLLNLVVLFLFLVFCIDTTIVVWKRGDHRKALVFGGGVSAFVIFIAVISISVIWFPSGLPLLASPAIMFLIMAIGFELNLDLHRSARLSKDLEHKDAELLNTVEQLRLSADAANVGVWIRSMDGELIWASEKWYELLELRPHDPITLNIFLARLEPADRNSIRAALTLRRAVGDEYEHEYRIVLNNGGIRWIRGHGKVDVTKEGAMILRGATVDITKLKLAQEAAHDLSHRLMDAQEKERARLARELHDGLGQSLALLSIQLEALYDPAGNKENWKEKIHELTSQVERLSSDVHRISHELHPSKLEQLGLEAALRGFCREMAAAHRFKIDFEAANIPRKLGRDVSLCIYRVAQEALQNIAKHSGASNVNVRLQFKNAELMLIVADNGSGFAKNDVRHGESLGFISMHERLKALNGVVEIETELGAGTKVVVTVPNAVEPKLIHAA